MKVDLLANMTTSQLTDRFTEIGIAQDRALFAGKIAKFNKLFDAMQDVVSELKRRQGDERRALMALYTFPNAQVRLKAAKATLAIAPIAARDVIETIASSGEFPQAGDAGMTLVNLDRGVFKST